MLNNLKIISINSLYYVKKIINFLTKFAGCYYNVKQQSVSLEKRGQKVKKCDADLTKIHGRSCKIRCIFVYSNLLKNMHKNTCFMPISIIFAIMK